MYDYESSGEPGVRCSTCSALASRRLHSLWVSAPFNAQWSMVNMGRPDAPETPARQPHNAYHQSVDKSQATGTRRRFFTQRSKFNQSYTLRHSSVASINISSASYTHGHAARHCSSLVTRLHRGGAEGTSFACRSGNTIHSFASYTQYIVIAYRGVRSFVFASSYFDDRWVASMVPRSEVRHVDARSRGNRLDRR